MKMKRLLLILLCIFILWSCEKSNKNIQVSNTTFSKYVVSVPDEITQTIGIKQIMELHPNVDFDTMDKSKQAISIQIDTSFIIKDKKGRHALHFFKYKNKKGWNIISGDKRFLPILAYNGAGKAMLDTSRNPGLKYWVEDILQQIDFMDEHEIKQSKKVKFQWEKYLNSSTNSKNIKNLPVDTGGCPVSNDIWATWNPNTSQWEGFSLLKWNQTAGFNYYMPIDDCDPQSYYCNKYPSGCGPVAIGMVMKYYNKPNSFLFNGINRTLNYNIMPSEIEPSSVNCSNPTDSQKEVATLLRYVSGKYAEMWCFSLSVPFYYTSESATALYPNKIAQTFSDWGYSSPGNKIDYSSNITRLTDNLKLRQPVIFSGSSCDVCFWDAHIWLCEGLKESHDELCSTYAWVYMNWGWGGVDNGWYGISSDYTLDGTTYNNAHMKIIVDIKP
jgi:hypothetical protein